MVTTSIHLFNSCGKPQHSVVSVVGSSKCLLFVLKAWVEVFPLLPVVTVAFCHHLDSGALMAMCDS